MRSAMVLASCVLAASAVQAQSPDSTRRHDEEADEHSFLPAQVTVQPAP